MADGTGGRRSRSPSRSRSEAAEEAGPTMAAAGPPNETNRHLPPNASWANNIRVTNEEKISLIQEYQLEREGDPRGLTSSGLVVFIKGKGVKMKKDHLSSHFLPGISFTMTSDGTAIISPSE